MCHRLFEVSEMKNTNRCLNIDSGYTDYGLINIFFLHNQPGLSTHRGMDCCGQSVKKSLGLVTLFIEQLLNIC